MPPRSIAWFCLFLAWPSGFLAPLSGADRAGRPIQVLTSFLPLYCFTSGVAGDLARVENLLPAGSGPHDYQFSARDLRRLAEADVLVVNGLGVEEWLDKLVRSATSRVRTTIVASAGLEGRLLAPAHGSDRKEKDRRPNPHIWLDPTLAAQMVTNILVAMQRVDPRNSGGYATNAGRYLRRLEELDAEMRRGTALLKGQPFVTYHDAFPYLVRRYGLNLAGVLEPIPDIGPSPRELKALLEMMRQKGVRAIFTEPQFSDKLARQIGRDLGIPVGELDPLETAELRPGSYEEGMRRNLAALQRYLR